MVHLFIVQGPRQSGKTTFLRSLYSTARHAAIRVSAVIEESERDHQGVPISLAFHTLETGTIRLLARRESTRPYQPFQFSQPVFDTVLAELGQASRTPGLIIIDEVGPYEVLEQKGLWPFFRDLPADRRLTLAVGIRPDLIEPFLHALAACHIEYELMAILPMAQSQTPVQEFSDSILACCQSYSLDL